MVLIAWLLVSYYLQNTWWIVYRFLIAFVVLLFGNENLLFQIIWCCLFHNCQPFWIFTDTNLHIYARNNICFKFSYWWKQNEFKMKNKSSVNVEFQFCKKLGELTTVLFHWTWQCWVYSWSTDIKFCYFTMLPVKFDGITWKEI